MTQEAKQQVEAFLRANDRGGALQYLQDNFNVSLENAELLVTALERDTQGAAVTHQGVSLNVGGCLQTVAKGMGVFFMLAGLMFLAAAGIVYFIQSRSINNSDRLKGLVTEMKSIDQGASAPVITYEWRGRKRSYESTFYSSPPDYHVGQEVFLFVNRDDEEDVTIDTFTDRWALIVGLLVLGGLLILISIVFFYFGRRKF